MTKQMIITALLFTLVMAINVNAQNRFVLLENFTNTGCGYCADDDVALDQLTEQHYDEFVAVRYHTSWPDGSDPYYRFNTFENNARKNYYNVAGVPTTKVDGYLTATSPNSFYNLIVTRSNMESPLEIDIDGTYDDDTREGTLNITLRAIDDAYWDSLYLRIALTESDLFFHAPNGNDWHHQTMRDMIPNANGINFDMSFGDTLEFSQDFAVNQQLASDNCELVVWVQSDYIKEVYQAARFPLAQTSIAESAELPENFSLAQNYPNPFNAKTTIYYNLKNTSTVKLEIYDLAGRKVATLTDAVQSAGDYQVVWDAGSVASGVYFYHLTADDKNLTKRMVLLK